MKKIYTYKIMMVTILAFSLLLGISSCKSKKISTIDGSGLLKSKSQNELLEDVLAHQLDYKTITTKGKVSLNGKEVTTIFKLVKDEYIQASIRPILGVEAMRVDITPDKAVLIDRLGAKYAEIDINSPQISEYVAFNFHNLQALFTNQLFLAGNKEVAKNNYEDFKISSSKDNYILQVQDKNKLTYDFTVDASDRIVSTKITSTEKEMSLNWTYDEFVEDKEFIYPTTMLADVKVKKKNFKIGISYSNLDINTYFNLDRSVPSKYKKVDILELIGAYMKLK